MKKLMMLLLSFTLALTVVGCSSNGADDANIEVPSESLDLEAYTECLQRVMDEAAAAGTDQFDMSVCDNL
jgi:hypothetical protein